MNRPGVFRQHPQPESRNIFADLIHALQMSWTFHYNTSSVPLEKPIAELVRADFIAIVKAWGAEPAADRCAVHGYFLDEVVAVLEEHADAYDAAGQRGDPPMHHTEVAAGLASLVAQLRARFGGEG